MPQAKKGKKKSQKNSSSLKKKKLPTTTRFSPYSSVSKKTNVSKENIKKVKDEYDAFDERMGVNGFERKKKLQEDAKETVTNTFKLAPATFSIKTAECSEELTELTSTLKADSPTQGIRKKQKSLKGVKKIGNIFSALDEDDSSSNDEIQQMDFIKPPTFSFNRTNEVDSLDDL